MYARSDVTTLAEQVGAEVTFNRDSCIAFVDWNGKRYQHGRPLSVMCFCEAARAARRPAR